jgi:hypothetical protein
VIVASLPLTPRVSVVRARLVKAYASGVGEACRWVDCLAYPPTWLTAGDRRVIHAVTIAHDPLRDAKRERRRA